VVVPQPARVKAERLKILTAIVFFIVSGISKAVVAPKGLDESG